MVELERFACWCKTVGPSSPDIWGAARYPLYRGAYPPLHTRCQASACDVGATIGCAASDMVW
jgi:hypothetical protein